MIRISHLIGAAVAAIVTASAANAASFDDYNVHHVKVIFSDLNLATPDGRAALEARIDDAATEACGGSPVFWGTYRDAPFYTRAAFDRCRTDARREAVANLVRQGVRIASK